MTDTRPVWLLTASGHVVAADRRRPGDAVTHWCREGDATWTANGEGEGR